MTIIARFVQNDVAILDINDQVNFSLLPGWRPPSSRERRSALGNGEYYEPVETGIPFRVFGNSPQATKAALREVAAMVQEVQKWKAGAAEPVTFEYLPEESDLAGPPATLVLDTPARAREIVELPATFNHLMKAFEVNPVILPLVMRGGLYGPAETLTAAAANNPTVRTVTFGEDAVDPSPVDVRVTGFTDQTHTTIYKNLLLITNDANDLALFEAESMTATGWTSAALDSAERAGGNAVLRYSPTGAAESISGSLSLTSGSFNAASERVAIFAKCRVTGSGRTFRLRAEVASYVFNDVDRTANQVLRQADYADPLWVPLGITTLRQGHRTLRLVASVNNISGASLDIDQIAIMALGPSNFALRHEQAYLSSPFIASSPSSVKLAFEQRILSERRPWAGYIESSAGNEAAFGKRGDIRIFMTGTAVSSLWLATSASKWVDVNQATNAITQVGAEVSRRLAFLTPM